MSEENQLTATIDINGLFQAYNKPDFMEKVLTNFLKENPEIVINQFCNEIIVNVLKSDEFEDIKKSVNDELKTKVEHSVKQSYCNPIDQKVDTIIKDLVKQKKTYIEGKVSKSIEGETIKEKVREQVIDVISQKVFKVIERIEEGEGYYI